MQGQGQARGKRRALCGCFVCPGERGRSCQVEEVGKSMQAEGTAFWKAQRWESLVSGPQLPTVNDEGIVAGQS